METGELSISPQPHSWFIKIRKLMAWLSCIRLFVAELTDHVLVNFLERIPFPIPPRKQEKNGLRQCPYIYIYIYIYKNQHTWNYFILLLKLTNHINLAIYRNKMETNYGYKLKINPILNNKIKNIYIKNSLQIKFLKMNLFFKDQLSSLTLKSLDLAHFLTWV
jgi:hypothetical protein